MRLLKKINTGKNACATSAAADGGDDGDLGVLVEFGGKAAGIARVFVADEEVHVFADLALFGEDAIAETRMAGEQGIERVAQSCGTRKIHDDLIGAAGERVQAAGYVNRNRHISGAS